MYMHTHLFMYVCITVHIYICIYIYVYVCRIKLGLSPSAPGPIDDFKDWKVPEPGPLPTRGIGRAHQSGWVFPSRRMKHLRVAVREVSGPWVWQHFISLDS